MLSTTVTRQESYDPLSIIEQATRQAVAEQIARERAHPGDPKALAWRYERDSNSAGDYVDLVITGTDEMRMGLVLRRLRAHGYDDLCVEWLADEDPPHLIEVVSATTGRPPSASRAREVLEELGFHVPLVPVGGSHDGFYKTSIPAMFPASSTVKVADSSEWVVRIIHHG